jgi:pimeloyl-ACP methyl ester carboxylesterase
LTEEIRVAAIAGLDAAVASLRPLAEAGYPLRVSVPDDSRAGRLASVADRAGVPIQTASSAAPGRFDSIVDSLLRPYVVDGGAAPRVVGGGLDELRSPAPLVTADGVRLRLYTAGRPGDPPIVLASACGMPAQLCEAWLRVLGERYFVVTWETRGLFGGLGSPADFDGMDAAVAAQAGDLLAVMDHFGLSGAHLMGLCGGAVIALRAAAAHPGRVHSLSLWHGDFSGTPGPTTSHQDNLKALLAMASISRADAGLINDALAQTALGAVPADVAHLVVYPYVSNELFYRYCVLTNATMTTDASADLDQVSQPCLVVTSDDDHTAHPGGSHAAAARLRRAVLQAEPHGDHISVFAASPRIQQILADFLGSVSYGTER